jgi:hypothetical protein
MLCNPKISSPNLPPPNVASGDPLQTTSFTLDQWFENTNPV